VRPAADRRHDALTTAAWSIMILGQVPKAAHGAVADLYLLTDIDVP